MKGTVKWFSDSKGYGFVIYEGNTDPGAYVHYTAILGDGFKTLYEEQEIEFDLVDGPKGPQATNVVKVKL